MALSPEPALTLGGGVGPPKMVTSVSGRSHWVIASPERLPSRRNRWLLVLGVLQLCTLGEYKGWLLNDRSLKFWPPNDALLANVVLFSPGTTSCSHTCWVAVVRLVSVLQETPAHASADWPGASLEVAVSCTRAAK